MNKLIKAWKKFEEYYRSSHILRLNEGGGTPSIQIWNEEDIKLNLYRFLLEEYPSDYVHCEVILGKYANPRVDMIITNSQASSKNIRQNINGNFKLYEAFTKSNYQVDIAIEIAVILSRSLIDKTYGYGKLVKNINSLSQNKLIKRKVVCFIDKISEGGFSNNNYDPIRRLALENDVKLLGIFDN